MKGQTRNYSAVKMTELLEANPLMTNVELAQEIGVTRQRVSQLRKKLNLPIVPSRRLNWHPCPGCGKSIRQRSQYCSIACHYDQVLLTCETCGKQFGRSKSAVKQSDARQSAHTWCSKQCQGTWFGKLKKRLTNLVHI